MKNEILSEVWKNRDNFARRCHHNLNLMVRAIQKVERTGRNPIVDRTKKRTTKVQRQKRAGVF
jgi:hypothetical protein